MSFYNMEGHNETMSKKLPAINPLKGNPRYNWRVKFKIEGSNPPKDKFILAKTKDEAHTKLVDFLHSITEEYYKENPEDSNKIRIECNLKPFGFTPSSPENQLALQEFKDQLAETYEERFLDLMKIVENLKPGVQNMIDNYKELHDEMRERFQGLLDKDHSLEENISKIRKLDVPPETQEFLITQLNNAHDANLITLERLVKMFMDSRINEGLSDYTLARYNQITKQYIVGKPFGEKPLSKVSREDVLNIRNSIVNAGHIPTANKFVLVLSAMFNYAINQIKPPPISQNPCYRIKKVDMIAIESPQLKTDNMLDPFKIDSLDLKEKALLAILIGGGLRRGEAFALQKRHIVEVEDGLIIQVRQSIVLLDCKVCKLKPPKSNSGNRDVVVFSEFTPYITDYIGTLNDPSSWLFPKSITNKYGNAPTIASANNLWKSIAKKTGLDKKNFDNKRITMHQMRHTHATIFLDRGLDSKLAQANLGHKSDSLTKSVYQEADVGKRRTAMKNIRNVDVK